MQTWQKIVTAAFAATTAAFALACGPTPPPPDTAPDLFRLAVDGLPGGSLLSVWGDPNAGVAYLAGGYVGVDPARLAGAAAGRMLVYNGGGSLHTACTAASVLWWTAPVDHLAWASGENGTIVRYREGGACEVVDTGLSFAEGAPTYWGFAQLGAITWFVGGSASPAGPKGVIVRYDGTTFTRVDAPPEARGLNLYKISARTSDELIVVGEGGIALRLRDGSPAVVDATNVNSSDDRLFTVNCLNATCWAVGGQNTGVTLFGTATPDFDAGLPFVWGRRDLPVASGWNGVWSADDANTFFVGVNGQTMHTNGVVSFLARSLTPATLHGVGGWTAPIAGAPTIVVAVGGELDTPDATQRAVILVRGDDSPSFTVDGRAFVPTGTLRRSLGGAGQ